MTLAPTRPEAIRADVDLSRSALESVTAELAATAPEYDRTGAVPRAGLEAAHRAGLLTATVGARHGGPGLGPVDTARILVALGEGDPSVALLAANNLAVHAAQAVNGHWPEAAYDDLLRHSAAGPALANSIRAEPELGAPARGGLPTTTARRTAEGWSVSGHKAYATGGAALAYHVVWVVTDEEVPRVGHLLVPADAPGITWIETWDHLGLRASNTHDVVYDDVLVPRDNFVEIPLTDGAYRDPAATAGPWSFGHPALYLGVARAARTAFAAYARQRVPTALGRPIATTERIQSVAGEIEAQIAQAETLLYGSLLRLEHGADPREVEAQLSVVKVQIGRSVIAAVNAAVAALGNPALTRANPLERHLRDVLCVRIHPPQEDSALVAAGRRILGEQ
ncbi:acyl-CoA dehydrogenase family protein [Nocardioides sp. GXZ039]|uniref:acyl-CoA dehydrogenase family protein n=1 Tax=Nocardioides sp. GXZ039 TaxID=3136018 RepID=UPI0030F40CF8